MSSGLKFLANIEATLSDLNLFTLFQVDVTFQMGKLLVLSRPYNSERERDDG